MGASSIQAASFCKLNSSIRYNTHVAQQHLIYWPGACAFVSTHLLVPTTRPMAELSESKKKLADEFFILGLTSDGRQFRPSDWAERLCGVMSCFRPEGSGGRNAHLQFSPYVRPTMLDGVKAVVVNNDLQKLEPLAYHFVLNFAKDNDLQIIDACILPEPGEPKI